MEQSAKIAYFGYGSLVNLETLKTPYLSAHRARLTGWKRRWLSRPKNVNGFAPIEGLAFLSVEPCPDTIIDGMIIVDHRSSLPSLDEREVLYDRLPIQLQQLEFLDDNPLHGSGNGGNVNGRNDGDLQEDGLFLYAARQPAAGPQARILRSYLDVVMRGYHGHFGEDGIRRFIDTTENFDCGILEDRHEPIYPRSITVQQAEVDLFARHVPHVPHLP